MEEDKYSLHLFVSDNSPRSDKASANLSKFCAAHLPGKYLIQKTDVSREPALADRYRIFAVPTLVKETPSPVIRITGDLSDPEMLKDELGITPEEDPGKNN